MDKVRYITLTFVGVALFFSGIQTGANEENAWSIIKDIASILASSATVLGLTFAYDAYRSWKKQITHPKQYEKELRAFKNLNIVHDKIYRFSCSGAYQIAWAYERANEKYELNQVDSAATDLFTMRNIVFEAQIDETFKEFMSKVEGELTSGFDSHNDLPEPILLYRKCLLNYLKYTRLISFKAATNPLNNDFRNSRYKIKDLTDDGVLYKELVDSLNHVRQYFKKKWG